MKDQMDEHILTTIQEEWKAFFNQHRLTLVMKVREEILTLFEQLSAVEVLPLHDNAIQCEFHHSTHGKATLTIYKSAGGSSIRLYIDETPRLKIRYLFDDVEFKKENLTNENEIEGIKHFLASWYHICKEHLEIQEKEK